MLLNVKTYYHILINYFLRVGIWINCLAWTELDNIILVHVKYKIDSKKYKTKNLINAHLLYM